MTTKLINRGTQTQLTRQILRPALRFCVRRGIKFHEILEAMKHELVEVALNELAERGERKSVARASVMTGLNRREVTRLKNCSEKIDDRPSLIQRLIGQWQGDRRFATKSGKPRALSYGDDESEFTELVKAVNQDITAGAVLSELDRIGVIEKSNRTVKLTFGVEDAGRDPSASFTLLARDSSVLYEVVEENVYGDHKHRNHHSRTEYDNVFQDAVPQIKAWLYSEGVEFHKKIRNYLAQFDKDINPDPERDGGARVLLTSFTWATGEDKHGEEAKAA